MVFLIKLKTGFFETKFCTMSVMNKRIKIFFEDDLDQNEIIIPEEELLSIAIFSKKGKNTEIEIHTKEKIYVGNYIENRSKDEVINTLVDAFDAKVAVN